MTYKELKEGIDTLKKEGHTDQEIMNSAVRMWQNHLFGFNVLEIIVDYLGYELPDEFYEKYHLTRTTIIHK